MIVKCVKLVRVIKLYHDAAGQQNITFEPISFGPRQITTRTQV
jgi:hypothetical protein